MKNIALSGASGAVLWTEGWLTCQEKVRWLKHEGLHKDGHQSFWFSVCFCSDLTTKVFVYICMLSRIDSLFYWHGVSSEETLHYPNSDRSQGGREAGVAPSENHHIAFQSIRTADCRSLLPHPPELVPSSVETEECDRVELKLLVRSIFDHIFRICRGPIKTGPRSVVWTPLV